MRGILLLLCLWAPVGAAQTMYKCTDARQHITYSSESCDKLGLKDAGPVVDHTTSMPFTPPPSSAARKDAAKTTTPRDADDASLGRGGTQVTPVVPLLEKLTK